jgi:lipoprotein-releasing system permease protein
LFAKKSHNAINVITLVSVVGVAVCTMALVIILSVTNGFQDLVFKQFDAYNPDLEIRPAEGKVFVYDDASIQAINDIDGVAYVSRVLQEKAVMKYRDRHHLVTMRGVDENYVKITRLDTAMVAGDFILSEEEFDYFVIGYGVEMMLGANIDDLINELNLYVPRRGRTSTAQITSATNATTNRISGIFSVNAEVDMEYVILPIRLARELLEYSDEVNYLFVGLEPNVNPKRIQQSVQELVGSGFEVRNRMQQQEFFYKVMQSEKWAIFLILSLALLIVSFNLIGSLTMLVIEKTRDIGVLHKLGASMQTIKRIFLFEGMMISLGGAFIGLILGALVCWLQIQFGVVSIQAQGSFIVDAYPVKMEVMDFVFVTITVVVIGVLASIIPSRNISMLLKNN